MKTLHVVRSQSGAALISALIILVVMTLIGSAGMDGTILESKMVANFRERAIAINAADSSSREAQAWLARNSSPVAIGDVNECTNPPMCGLSSGYPIWEDNVLVGENLSWTEKDWEWWVDFTVPYVGTADQTSYIAQSIAQPRSVIEHRPYNQAGSNKLAPNIDPEKASMEIGWHYYNVYGAGAGLRAESFGVIEATIQKYL